MLDKLRNEALALIAATPQCTLSTIGPAGIQASIASCVVCADCIYILLPSTSEHLFNLEYETEVVLTSMLWQLRAAALTLGAVNGLQGTAPREISARARTEGHALVEIFPLRMHIEPGHQRRYRETIDFYLRS